MQVGTIADAYISELNCSYIIWCRTLKQVSPEGAVPPNNTKSQVNTHQNKGGFTEKIVPKIFERYWLSSL